MTGLPLVFAAPLVLLALAGLPVLYYLLRVTPPPPRQVPLPTMPLVQDLTTPERQASRTPWWLLVLRLALVTLAILALAGPRWAPDPSPLGAGRGPLVLLIDNGWAAAADWSDRRTRALSLLEAASERPVVLRASADEAQPLIATSASTAIERLRSLAPVAYTPIRARQFDVVSAFMAATPEAEALWLSDAIAGDKDETVGPFLAALGARLKVIRAETSATTVIAGATNERDATVVTLARAEPDSDKPAGIVRALDARGRALGEATFDFGGGATAQARITVPLEVRNDMSRLEIVDGRNAGAVHLLDAGAQRRKVAIVSGETADTAQPLVSGAYFVTRAMAPFATLVETPRGTDPLARTIDDRPEVIVLIDVATIAGSALERLETFVDEGGVLIRFAGSGLANASDALLPVRLRRGGRVLGGALSWEKPQRLASFAETGPFAGLAVPDDVAIERQVLAEPDPALTERTWAALSDGTPLVTASRRGKGLVVLFHVTADTGWSNLPLSGIFVDMLRRIMPLAVPGANRPERQGEVAAPRLILDGFGQFGAPPPTARAVARSMSGPASADHPAGFYGPVEAAVAVNVLPPDARLAPLAFETTALMPLKARAPLDLRPPLMVAAVLLFLIDAIAVAALAGLFFRQPMARAAGLVIAAVALSSVLSSPAPAQDSARKPPSRQDIEASLQPRLAYIRTGNAAVDETSQLGLAALTRTLAARTSMDPGEPVGLDAERDELVFYSLIYWPITPDRPAPGEAAMRRIDQFMKNGGTVIFDTRDASALATSSGTTMENRRLRQMLATLDIPQIEPIPRDHVLTKTFYLLDRLIGRYAQGETWVESMPRATDSDKRPARAGDRVSPVIITSNDLAAAWAVDRAGQPRFPLVPGEPRQREMAMRAGINLVMYAMTGNYKADQVHIPALLERLGQ